MLLRKNYRMERLKVNPQAFLLFNIKRIGVEPLASARTFSVHVCLRLPCLFSFANSFRFLSYLLYILLGNMYELIQLPLLQFVYWIGSPYSDF